MRTKRYSKSSPLPEVVGAGTGIAQAADIVVFELRAQIAGARLAS